MESHLSRPATAWRRGRMLLDEELRLHRRVVQRDERALLEYLDRIGHVVYCMALLRTAEDSAAEDLTEALFLEFWRDPDAFPPRHGPLALQLISRMKTDFVAAF